MLEAVLQNDLDTVKKLVSQGADINYNDQWGNCAIFSAAWEGNIKAAATIFSSHYLSKPLPKPFHCQLHMSGSITVRLIWLNIYF